MSFKKGLHDALPIMLGYLFVSFSFGVLATNQNFPVWVPISISATNLTGTGQFAGLKLIFIGASYIELFSTMLVVNCRYSIMSISLSYHLDEDVNMFERLFIAFGNTDEIFGVAMSQYKPLKFNYMAGLIVMSYFGWIVGTILGALSSNLFPSFVLSALGIALFAMFVAIIMPKMRESKPILLVSLIAIAISSVFYYTPVISSLSKGWVIIIAGVSASVLMALIKPIKEEPEDA